MKNRGIEESRKPVHCFLNICRTQNEADNAAQFLPRKPIPIPKDFGIRDIGFGAQFLKSSFLQILKSSFFQLRIILVVIRDRLDAFVEVEQSVVFIGGVDVVGIESETHQDAVHIEHIFKE